MLYDLLWNRSIWDGYVAHNGIANAAVDSALRRCPDGASPPIRTRIVTVPTNTELA